MSSIKNVVKVMNFHSLLRVDASKKKAEKYFLLEKELTMMIQQIMYNRNFILDKNMLLPDPDAPVLNIYFGSDFGFCSNYNSQIMEMMGQERTVTKIVIGEKVVRNDETVILKCSKDTYENDPQQLYDILQSCIDEAAYREINIIFNRYQSVSDIHIEKKKVYPFLIEEKEDISMYQEDYLCEDDVHQVLRNMMVLYLFYQVELCHINTNAAENVLRQNTTSESLKKIDERDEIHLRERRKEIKSKQFRKTIESFTKQNAMRGGKI